MQCTDCGTWIGHDGCTRCPRKAHPKPLPAGVTVSNEWAYVQEVRRGDEAGAVSIDWRHIRETERTWGDFD